MSWGLYLFNRASCLLFGNEIAFWTLTAVCYRAAGGVVWGSYLGGKDGEKEWKQESREDGVAWQGGDGEQLLIPLSHNTGDSWDFIPLPGACVVSVGCGGPGSILGVRTPIPVSSSV